MAWVNMAVAALALNSHGQVQWQLKIGHHVAEQPQPSNTHCSTRASTS